MVIVLDDLQWGIDNAIGRKSGTLVAWGPLVDGPVSRARPALGAAGTISSHYTVPIPIRIYPAAAAVEVLFEPINFGM